MAKAWLLQANPTTKFDVFRWWEETNEELTHWTLRQDTRADIGPGDDFVFWVGGKEAGVYAIGKVTSGVEYGPIDDDEYWDAVPEGDVPGVYLDTTHYLFDQPLRKAELLTDPAFAQSLIIRMPRTGNPVPLEPAEWEAVRSRVGGRRRRPRVDISGPVVAHRPIGRVPEETDVAAPSGGRFRTFPEARLVKAYERWLGRDLVLVSVVLPDGDRLVCDAYDANEGLLIEAKGAATRDDVRTAIGQLYDYRRFIKPRPALAVLLPEAPSDDVQELLQGLGIGLIVQSGDGFKTLT